MESHALSTQGILSAMNSMAHATPDAARTLVSASTETCCDAAGRVIHSSRTRSPNANTVTYKRAPASIPSPSAEASGNRVSIGM